MIELSIIIPTCNRCSLLNETLKSILTQTLPQSNFEVIVVDNNSTDDTLKVSLEYEKKFESFRYTFEKKPGLHEGRHAGLKASRGNILVYADDDIKAYPTWLEGIHESFSDKNVGLVGGKDIPLYEASFPAWLEHLWEKTDHGKYLTYFSLIDLGEQVMEIEPDFVFGCNFSVRKDLLLQIEGFHPDGFPEKLLKYRGDGETFVGRQIKKLGYKTIYNPKASVLHWVPSTRLNIEYLKKRAFMSGVSQSYTDTRERIMAGRNKSWSGNFRKKLSKWKLVVSKKSLRSTLLQSYYQGYDFHQDQLEKDVELIKWVTQKNYL